jgi:hypothetical protein
MCAKHKEDPSTYMEYDLELRLEAGATNKLNRNQIYSISMTIAWDMRVSCSALIIGTP